MRAAAARTSRTRRSTPQSRRPKRGALRHRGTGAVDRGAAGLAPAGGLTLPTLAGVPASYTHESGRAFAAQLAAELLAHGAAEMEDWTVAREPMDFLERTVARWVREAGGELHDEMPPNITLSSAPDADLWDDDVAPNIHRVWLNLDIGSPAIIELRPVIDVLALAHPQLPVTFYEVLRLSLHRLLPVWDASEAREWIDVFEEWVDEMRNDGEEWSIRMPEALRREPLSASALRRAVGAANPRARQLMERLAALLHATDAIQSQAIPDGYLNEADVDPPLWHILLTVDAGDTIQRTFDHELESRWQAGAPFAPTRLYPFDATRRDEVLRARDEVQTWTRALVAFFKLAEILPEAGTDPRALANVLEVEDADIFAELVRVRV